MTLGWVLVLALLMGGCSPSFQSFSLCNIPLRSVCVGPSDPVFVPCPGLESERFSLYLFKNQTRVAAYSVSALPLTWTKSPLFPTLSVDLTNHSSVLGFSLTADNSGHGLYVCEGQTRFPPPVYKKTGPEIVLVLVQGDQCDFKVDPEPVKNPALVWIISVASLSSYSLVTSILCATLWVKSRSREEERIYVNTKSAKT